MDKLGERLGSCLWSNDIYVDILRWECVVDVRDLRKVDVWDLEVVGIF